MGDLPPLEVTSWTGKITAAMLVAIFGTLLTSIVKQWGPWKKQASDDRAADFTRLREDVRDAKVEARRCADAVQRLENMVACMRPAISILTAEVKRLDPDNAATNAAILQVQELMAMAAAGDLGLAVGLRNLAEARGVKE